MPAYASSSRRQSVSRSLQGIAITVAHKLCGVNRNKGIAAQPSQTGAAVATVGLRTVWDLVYFWAGSLMQSRRGVVCLIFMFFALSTVCVYLCVGLRAVVLTTKERK